MKYTYKACSIVLASMFSLGFIACSKATADEKTSRTQTSTAPTSAVAAIAYVETDSLISQYRFCKDYTLLLTKKSESIQATLTAKGQALEKAMANYQKRIQSGAITSQEQATREQATLQKQQAELQALHERLSNEFAAEQENYNQQLRDSLQSFLKAYNKDKKLSIILSKAGDNILYADPSMDITNDVINGLNKRYKPTK